MEHYVQEVAAQTLISQLDPLSKQRVKAFEEASDFLLLDFLDVDVSKQERDGRRATSQCSDISFVALHLNNSCFSWKWLQVSFAVFRCQRGKLRAKWEENAVISIYI